MPAGHSVSALLGRKRTGEGNTHAVEHERTGGPGASGVDEFELAVRAASLVESAGDAVIGVAADGRITSWGEGARRMFGYLPEEAVGRHVSLLSPPESYTEQDALMQGALDAGTIERLDTVRVARDGRRLNVLVSRMPVTDRNGRVAGLLGLYRDITRQRDAESHLVESEQRHRAVVEGLTEAVIVTDVAGCILSVNDSASALLELLPRSLHVGERMSGRSIVDENGGPVATEDLPSSRCLRTGLPQRGIVLGLTVHGEVRHWLTVNSTPLVNQATGEHEGVVTSLTDITAQRRSIEELQRARLDDLERLARVAEYRDDDTFRHTERVGRLAERLALDLGLDDDTARILRRAAPLHDVGKIGIPDAILLKPDVLTDEEFAVMKTHTTIGETILANSHAPVLRMGTEIAATHHERWDGAGYPAGLRGHEIPIVGRIVAVADSFDAITHARPYRAAAPVEDAVAEIQRCSGGQFDRDVVDAFLSLDHARYVDID
jgi:putative two-component system response regulator